MIARTTNGIANFGAQLNDRLVHLRFDLLFERDFSAFENFVNMRTQLARLGVDDRELLFNSQSERVVLHAMPRTKNIRRFCRFTQIICEKNPLSAEICVIRGWKLRRVRPTNVALPQLAGTFPSLDCPDRERARAPCGGPFRRLLPPPTRSCPGRSTQLRNQGRDCKSRSLPARHRAWRIPRCSGRNREIDS